MKLSEFKFLTDENIPPEIIQFFHHGNFNITSVLSEGLIGHSDADICALAFSQNRVIVTQD